MFAPIQQSVQDEVTELYLGFFGRAPEPAGLLFWATQVQAGTTSILQVADQFSQSIEFSRQYDGLSAEKVVTKIYEHVLDRAPDSGGLTFWSNALNLGTPVSSLVWTVVDSAFDQIGTADGLLVQGKVYQAQAIIAPIIHQQSSVPWNVTTGFGEINVAAALSAVLASSVPQTTSFNSSINQWAISTTHFHDAWTAGFTGKGVVIANLDSGIDLSNNALTTNLSTHNWNFITNTADVQDDNGHGTATASVMISNGALTGAAYDAELMVLKVIDSQGNGSQANLVKAINYAVEHGADVINVPLGGISSDADTLAALVNANNHGVIVCMASGNSASNSPQFPANYAQQLPNCIAVGATISAPNDGAAYLPIANGAGSLTPYAFVGAPGSQIYAYGLDGQIKSWTGTSFSTPLVAAEAAVLLSANSGLATSEIVSAIVYTTTELTGIQTIQPV